MKPFWKTKEFQIRWNEPLGKKECPYAYRWVFIFFGYSIRIHKWLRSDDFRNLHDHAFSFWTCVIKGSYIDVSENEFGGIRKELVMPFKPVYRPAEHKHYVQVPHTGCVTLLLASPKKRNWGFWVNGKSYRPLRYFSRHGHVPCDIQ